MREVLLSKYGILTTFIGGEEYSGLRITPNVYNTLGEVDTFTAAVEKELL